MAKLIFIHGAFWAAKDLLPLSLHCRKQNIKLITLPFHGSEAGQPFTYPLLKHALRTKLQSEENYSLFGYSLGGYLALDLAVDGHIAPLSITTYGTRFFWTNEIVERISKVMKPEKLRKDLPEYVEDLVAMHGEAWTEVISSTLGMRVHLIHNPLSEKSLSAIKSRTTLVIGDGDILTNMEETKSVSATIPSCTFEIIPGEHDLKKLSPASLIKIAHFLSLQNA